MKHLRLRNWSLRAKLAVLVMVASVIPLTIGAWIDIRETRAQLVAAVENVLAARAEQIANSLDAAHANYEGQGDRIARLPDVLAYCAADAAARLALRDKVKATFAVGLASDSNVRSIAIIDAGGRVAVATSDATVGLDLSSRASFLAAIGGARTITGVYLSSPATGAAPSVAYLAPVPGPDGRPRCVTALAVHADTFWRPLKAAGGQAGPGSFAQVLDESGVRIGHTAVDTNVYHPAGALPRSVVDEQVAAGRFGPRTRELLEDVRPFPEIFSRALAGSPDRAMFRGVAPSNAKLNYGVGRRLQKTGWTVFYLEPEENVAAQVAAATREKVLFSVSFIGLAALFGFALAAGILRQVRTLGDATARLAMGETDARIRDHGNDELGRLAASFNAMADRIHAQSSALQLANANLETRVRERSGLLNAVLDNSPAAIALKDLEGRYLLVNEGAAKALRAGKNELIGKTIYDFFPPETADRVRDADARVVEAGRALSEEFLAAEPEGIHTYLGVKFPVREGDGPVYAIGNIALDITDRKAAESRLLVQLDRMNLLDQITTAIGERQDLPSIYQVVISSLEDKLLVDFCGILDHDPAADVLTVARVGACTDALAAQFTGVEAARIPVDANGLSRCVGGQLVYEPDISGSAFAFPLRLAQAGLRSLVLAPLLAEGRVRGVLAVARRQSNAFASADCEFLRQLGGHVALAGQQALLTEALRKANIDLRESQQRILQQERLSALGQMASGIAHDINNAMSPAALYVESLLERETGLSPRARGQLEIISRAIDDVAATVARMREFYREREARSELLPVDLNELAGQVADLTRARWRDLPQQRGVQIRLRRDLAPGLPRVMGIESEIREALTNLVLNAVDAMPQGGELVLRTSVADGGRSVRVEVIDNGVGMDEATRRSCLEPFFTTKGERGTGLGLAMVYGIAQRHDAKIGIESAPGQGTRVHLSFAAPPPEQSQPVAPPAVEKPAPRRILIVDDDPLLLQSVGESLRADGHSVTAARGGQAGIDLFLSHLGITGAFEAVITDLGMPQVDGRKVAEAVKQASPGTRVIMLTGWGQRLVEEGETLLQVDKVLNKPPKLRELRAALWELFPGGGT